MYNVNRIANHINNAFAHVLLWTFVLLLNAQIKGITILTMGITKVKYVKSQSPTVIGSFISITDFFDLVIGASLALNHIKVLVATRNEPESEKD